MFICLEIDRPFQWKPWRSKKCFLRVSWDVGWGWFALRFVKKPFHEFGMEAHNWTRPDGTIATSLRDLQKEL